MFSCTMTEIKDFMSKLLLKDTFDRFLLLEATLVTYNTFTIDGHIKEEYFTKEELEEMPGERISAWEALRPVCFQLIKGKKTPCQMKLVFGLPENGINRLLLAGGLPYQRNDIEGLYINIKYDSSRLTLVTGVSMRTFTMDKSLEREWDTQVMEFLKKSEILYEG